MIDIDKLKALSELVATDHWSVDEERESREYQGFMVVDSWRCHVASTGTENNDKITAEFIAAANPAAVLELIADVEANRHEREVVCTNYDQLKAENEALRKDAERFKWTNTEGNWVSRMFGKWRAHSGGEYGAKAPTDYYQTREEAIDAALALEKQS